MDPFTAIIDALAVFRLARVVAVDSLPLVASVRRFIEYRWPGENTEFYDSEVTIDAGVTVNRYGRPLVAIPKTSPKVWVAARTHWFGTLVTCVWCNSFWVAAGVVALRYWWDWWQWPALALAFSAVAGTLFVWSNR